MARILRWVQAATPPLMRTGGLAHGLRVNEVYDRAVILEINPAKRLLPAECPIGPPKLKSGQA